MESIVHAGLSNAVLVCVLALVAGLVSYFCRRPALRHALWLLVLLKLVTPPLVNIPIPQFLNQQDDPRPCAAEPTRLPPRNSEEPLILPDPRLLTHDLPGEAWVVLPEEERQQPTEQAFVPPSTTACPPEPPVSSATATAFRPSWQTLLAGGWLLGSVLTLGLALRRIRRFRWLLRFATPALAELHEEAEHLARRLGLRASPPILLIRGQISPMLWGLGLSPRLVLPAELLTRLDSRGRQALLTHELAHLRRGDHHVRFLELAVTILFWWHPVVWWARREIHEAEEQCCDAWVVWAMPDAARSYALALVETVDFLCQAPISLPPVASGLGHVSDLKRRVTMIMQGKTPRALGWASLLGLLGTAVFLLPVMPTFAQSKPEKEKAPSEPSSEEARKTEMDLKRLRQEVETRRAEIRAMEERLRESEARLAKALAGADTKEKQEKIIIVIQEGGKTRTIEVPASAEWREVTDLIRLRHTAPAVKVPAVVTLPQIAPVSPPLLVRPLADGGTERRLNDLEKKLTEVMRELEALRREMKKPTSAAPARVTPPATAR